LFERFDGDGDGKLTKSEAPERVWTHVSAADGDGDGAVTLDELKQAHADGKIGPPPGRRGPGRRAR
jgi:hypothetical protein